MGAKTTVLPCNLSTGERMNHFFVSSGYIEPAEASLLALPNFHALPPFLRVLLTTDGTVTKSLESYFWEPVKVETLAQGWITLAEDKPEIARTRGDKVWQRQVRLVGQKSKTEYAQAQSHICADQLPAHIREALEAGKVGIGELLRECGLETYRQITCVGSTPDDGRASAAAGTVWRSYRIVMGHQPFIQIREEFPVSVYL